MQYAWFKRFLDVLFSLIALIILSPFLLIFAFFIKLDSRGPIFYTQERVGRFGDPFKIIKFRTMQIGTPECSTEELGDSNRYITRYGHFLRKFGIDELPQFINVLKGDMSIIGPRPVIPAESTLTKLRIKNGSLAIRPGLSGWAQVNGRDAVSVSKKASLDGYYAQNMSLFFDALIFFLTVFTVITHSGYKEGVAIKKMPDSKIYNRFMRRMKIALQRRDQKKKKEIREQKKAQREAVCEEKTETESQIDNSIQITEE